MRVTMATVWDRTSEVLAGRQTILGSIALATLWLPAVVQQAIGGALVGTVPASGGAGAAAGGAGALVGLISIVVGVVGLWGKLAVVAVASDPATGTADAYRLAGTRLPLLIGLAVLVGLGFVVLAIPLMVMAAPFASQVAAYGSATMTPAMNMLPPGQRGVFSLYGLALLLGLLWVVVRLLPLNPVVLNERAGLGSYRRSFQITQGHFWRLLGVLLLFGIVVGVAAYAVQAVVGIAARLLAGAEHPAIAAFVTTLFTAAVAAAGNVVALVFTTQFYWLRRETSVQP